MNRILAIDYGDARIGLALSDPMCIISQPFEVWENQGEDIFFKKLDELIKLKKVNKLVIGLPKNMNGTEGFQALKIREIFDMYENEMIEKKIYYDERLSSKKATEILHKQGKSEKEQKGIKDAYAASVFLKEYLDYGGK